MISLRPARSAPVAYSGNWNPHTWILVVVAATVVGLGLGGLATMTVARGPLAQYEYHLWRWEADKLVGNAFALAGIGPDPNDVDGERAVREYFRLTSQIRAAQESARPDTQLAETLAGERSIYTNDVERLIERYIDEAVTGAGLQQRLPLFHRVRLTWPPVDFELTSPPHLLVRSPRDRIDRKGDRLLRNDLSLRDIESIERKSDSANTVSIVVPIGGLAAYPAMVRDDRSYDAMLDTASHEWVHHYLAFHPLGRQWGNRGDAEPLNETTANIAGREIAALVRGAHPIDLPQGSDGRVPAGPAPTVDYNQEMQRLRKDVDALLAAGKVAEAERTMEERRQYFAEHGIAIRKINQAYFAFYGTYADTPASMNPIGPKIERVWELTKDVGRFLRVMRDVETTKDLDARLAALEGGARPAP